MPYANTYYDSEMPADASSGDSKQIVMEGVGLRQEKYPTLNGQGTGVVRRFDKSPNDHMFEDPSAQHIFLNVSGLTREAAIVFDSTKTYDIVITEAEPDPVQTEKPTEALPPVEVAPHTD